MKLMLQSPGVRSGVWSILALVSLTAACVSQSEKAPPVPADAVPADRVLGEAVIAGRVTYEGAVPVREPINMGSDAACLKGSQSKALSESIIMNTNGSLRNVFVHVVSGIDRIFAPPETPVRLEQRGCMYRPHVLGLLVGQPLLILNEDPTLHNVHGVSTRNPPFNFGMSVVGQSSTRYFHQSEVMVKLKCDVHPWMASYVGVSTNPFFDVTGEAGGFVLKDLPPGDYVVEAWHETLGTVRQNVSVREGERVEIVLDYPG